MLLSIIIPCHKKNEKELGKLLIQCRELKCFYRKTQTEVIVVFNRYENKKPEISLNLIDKYKFYSQPLIIGMARNIGASLSSGNIMMFVDSDVTLPKKTILEIKPTIKKMTSSGYCSILPNYKEVVKSSIYAKLDSREDIRSYRGRVNNDGITASSLSGPFVVIKRCMFFDLGGWEERNVCAEDKDLAARIMLTGNKIMYAENLEIFHNNSSSIKVILKRKLFHAKCNALVYERYPQFFHRSLMEWLEIVSSKFSLKYPLQSTIYVLIMIIYLFFFYFNRIYIKIFKEKELTFRKSLIIDHRIQ
ncbi:MAG: hypothetical protein COV26_01985 [Candidatus Nealsonbacteria bacterium CG10_big_fil_rev_8_21_14_0_10_36_23]|uniref:Glycosyltransferase 2-like domain-containing protein n=1 Tax=Candidatus Nealsonbacteria bacterium CG10_big_fil_rev_8_21_14_0_10_36_23 TaxID=1974709 RepID=A0A2H0TKZ9_9BACT|nr:MAG: hypothetical protein COV26_01985 [Candidatus Nealsonbacteria bacterium CG10_big_fil_rev_8_21_14_0_10_36_23]